MNLALKQRAIRLRRAGKTYSEIKKAIGPLPKSTLSNWLKNIELTLTQKQRIRQKISDRSALGRQRGGWRNHQKRLERIANIQKAAKKEFVHFKGSHLFLSGLLLYLAEGSRKIERFQFMNSDPYLVKFMAIWLKEFGGITRSGIRARLYTHEVYANENNEKFWSNFLNIPSAQFYKTIYKPTPHSVKKNTEYKGCLRIEIAGSELYWKIMKWRDMLYSAL